MKIIVTPSPQAMRRAMTGGVFTLGLIILLGYDGQGLLSVAHGQSNLGRRLEEKKESAPVAEGEAEAPGGVRRKNNRSPRVPQVEVTFTTDAAGADVLVDGAKVGETDRDGKLLARVRAGRRTIAARHSGRQTAPQNVLINSTNKRFNFTLADNTSPQPAGTGAAAAPRGDADAIVERFRNPQQSSGVTYNEWQNVKLQIAQAYAANPTDAKIKALGLFTEGQLAYLRKDYATAVVRFTGAVTTLPTSDLAYYGLGNAYLMTNQAPQALRAFDRATELNKDFALAYRAKGDALTRLGKNDEALKMYTRARDLGYSLPDGQAQVARALMRKERWAEALKELQPLASAQPSAEVFLLIGECYQGLKQNVSALEAFRQAVKLNNRSAAAYFRQGQVMYDEREYQAATESLERALALDPAGNAFDRARARKMANEAMRKAGGNRKPSASGGAAAEGTSATSLLPQ